LDLLASRRFVPAIGHVIGTTVDAAAPRAVVDMISGRPTMMADTTCGASR
jgi:hypothetical protein